MTIFFDLSFESRNIALRAHVRLLLLLTRITLNKMANVYSEKTPVPLCSFTVGEPALLPTRRPPMHRRGPRSTQSLDPAEDWRARGCCKVADQSRGTMRQLLMILGRHYREMAWH